MYILQNRKLRHRNKVTDNSGGISIHVFYPHNLCPEPLTLLLPFKVYTSNKLLDDCVKKRKKMIDFKRRADDHDSYC